MTFVINYLYYVRVHSQLIHQQQHHHHKQHRHVMMNSRTSENFLFHNNAIVFSITPSSSNNFLSQLLFSRTFIASDFDLLGNEILNDKNWSRHTKENQFVKWLRPFFFHCKLTGTRSGYFRRILSPSARRFSNGCSSLYWNFILVLLFFLQRSINCSRSLVYFHLFGIEFFLFENLFCCARVHLLLLLLFVRWMQRQ